MRHKLLIQLQKFHQNMEEGIQDKLLSYHKLLQAKAIPAGMIANTVDELGLWQRHILDSIHPHTNERLIAIIMKSELVVDLGSGAGLPGIPLAIMNQDKKFLLVDSSIKRTQFLKLVKLSLGLNNVEIMQADVSNCQKDLQSISNKVILFRAFRKPLAALELSLNYLAINDKILYWRSSPLVSSLLDENIKVNLESRLEDLGIEPLSYVELEQLEKDNPRKVYIFKKIQDQAKGYPHSWKKINNDSLINSVI